MSKNAAQSNAATANRTDKHQRFGFIGKLITGFFLTGTILTYWEIDIYRQTFIPFVIPFGIWLLTGLAITLLVAKRIYAFIKSMYVLGFALIFNTCSFGAISVFAFMWLNYHFAEKVQVTVTTPIISSGHLGSGRPNNFPSPYAIVKYKDIEKQLVYPCSETIELYHTVDMQVAKGLFGFDVVLNSKLKK